MRIGVLAIQGSFSLHLNVLNHLGVRTSEIRKRQDLDHLNGIILPGGESTTFSLLLDKFELRETLTTLISEGMPVWGTCAGAILLGRGTDRPQPRLNMIEIDVARNAFGRQVDSFVQSLTIKDFKGDFPGVFIRAPRFSNPGSEVQILADLNGEPVMASQQNVLISSFHPELTADSRVHEFFITHFCE